MPKSFLVGNTPQPASLLAALALEPWLHRKIEMDVEVLLQLHSVPTVAWKHIITASYRRCGTSAMVPHGGLNVQ